MQTGAPPAKCTLEAGPSFYYHYIVENGVCYMALTARGYPKRLAFAYLEELQQLFERDHGHEVSTYDRPYAAIKFEPTMSRLRRTYVDPRSPAMVAKLNSDLSNIRTIMVSNIEEVLRRGEKLDSIEDKSASLASDSKKFVKASKYVRLQYFLRTMGPLVAVVLLVLFMLYWRFIA